MSNLQTKTLISAIDNIERSVFSGINIVESSDGQSKKLVSINNTVDLSILNPQVVDFITDAVKQYPRLPHNETSFGCDIKNCSSICIVSSKSLFHSDTKTHYVPVKYLGKDHHTQEFILDNDFSIDYVGEHGIYLSSIDNSNRLFFDVSKLLDKNIKSRYLNFIASDDFIAAYNSYIFDKTYGTPLVVKIEENDAVSALVVTLLAVNFPFIDVAIRNDLKVRCIKVLTSLMSE